LGLVEAHSGALVPALAARAPTDQVAADAQEKGPLCQRSCRL
jgi:hypothetical protein